MTIRRPLATAATVGLAVVLCACAPAPSDLLPQSPPTPSSASPAAGSSPTSSSASSSSSSSRRSSPRSSSSSPSSSSSTQDARNRMIDVTITGATGEWNGQSETYQTSARFTRRATLIIEPDPDGDGLAVALFAGDFASTSAGDMHFVTNTYLYRHTSAARFVWTAQVPVGRVDEDGPSGSLVATVDEPRSRIAQLSSFVVRSSGLYTNPKQITEGAIRITRLDDSGAAGEITLYGTGAIEPGNSFPTNKYRASFSSD